MNSLWFSAPSALASLDYNALYGGIERWFEPIQSELLNNPAWQSVLLGLAHLLNGLKPVNTWFVEAYQFRIDTTDGIGRPTPEARSPRWR